MVRLPDGRILAAEQLPEAAEALTARGYTCMACDVSEFARADGGLTCLSIRLRDELGPEQQ